MRVRSVHIATYLGSTLLLGCSYEAANTNHCVHNGGDAHCRRLFDFGRPYCVRSICEDLHAQAQFGCVTREPDPPHCWSPCGAESTPSDNDLSCIGGPSSLSVADSETQSSSDTTASDSTGEATFDSTTTTSQGTASTTFGDIAASESTDGSDPSEDSGSSSMVALEDCAEPEDCTDPAFPFCASNRCVPCSALGDGADSACNELDRDKPVCSPRGCVACTEDDARECGGTTPYCDTQRNECVPCKAHEHCGFSGCNLETGACLDSVLLHVNHNSDAGCSDDEDTAGGITTPLCTISRAVGRLRIGRPSTIIVHAGEREYREFSISGGKIVSLRSAKDDELPVIQGSSASTAAISISGRDTAVFIYRLGIVRSAGAGISVDGATLHFDRSQIENNTHDGLTATNGATIRMSNAFVVTNGRPTDDYTGIRLSGSETSARILYSTIALNSGSGTGAQSLRCESGAQADVRNSIVLGAQANSISCTQLQAGYNAADQALGEPGNLDVGLYQRAWFPRDDYRVIPGPPFQNVARWRPGDPATDFDGAPRPFGENAPDYAGADRPDAP